MIIKKIAKRIYFKMVVRRIKKQRGAQILTTDISIKTLKDGIGRGVLLNPRVICVGENQQIGDYSYIGGGDII